MNVTVAIVDRPLAPDTTPLPPPCEAGAALTFEGIVRPIESGEPIIGLRYETYDPMAEQQLRALSEQTVEKFDLIGVQVWHSRGFVPCGACSFRLVIYAVHRQEALAAMDWFIDTLKRDVPIWKHPVRESEPAQVRS